MRANTAMQPDSAPLPTELARASDLLHQAASIIGTHLTTCPAVRPVVPRMIAEAATLAEQARDNLQMAYNIHESGIVRTARLAQ